MKVMAYSDAHRGITANYDKLMMFGQRVEIEKPDLVLGVGDNYTLDWIPWVDIISWQPSGRSIAQQQRIASYIPWIEMLGNHDSTLADHANELHPVHVCTQKTLTLDGVTYTHGDQFDDAMKYCWSPLESIFWMWMPWLYPKLFGTPSVLKKSGHDVNYSKLVGAIEARAQLFAESGEIDKSLVFGHTHSEFIKYRSLHFIANCGDFIDSCSYIVVTDGVPELRWL
jgi:UDP-2,3-diacylglucosamine pyrophosphatase LpxH